MYIPLTICAQDIQLRQQAVVALMGPANEALTDARTILNGVQGGVDASVVDVGCSHDAWARKCIDFTDVCFRCICVPDAGMPDMERALSRLIAAANETGMGRYASHVVLYEDVSKRKVQQLVAAVHGLQALQRAIECFQGEAVEVSCSFW